MDNYIIHKSRETQCWLKENPKFIVFEGMMVVRGIVVANYTLHRWVILLVPLLNGKHILQKRFSTKCE